MPREIIILAKSIKHGGYCVAGKCTQNGQWIRPVSTKNGGAISDRVAKATNQEWIRQRNPPYAIKLLHKITMNFIRHVPLLHQQENHLNDINYQWLHKYSYPRNNLNTLLDMPLNLWNLGNHLDRVPSDLIRNIHNSLYLIAVQHLNLYVNNYQKRRATFSYNGTTYDLAVTDPDFDNIINHAQNFQTAILCVSLGEIYERNYYKLVATIFV